VIRPSRSPTFTTPSRVMSPGQGPQPRALLTVSVTGSLVLPPQALERTQSYTPGSDEFPVVNNQAADHVFQAAAQCLPPCAIPSRDVVDENRVLASVTDIVEESARDQLSAIDGQGMHRTVDAVVKGLPGRTVPSRDVTLLGEAAHAKVTTGHKLTVMNRERSHLAVQPS